MQELLKRWEFIVSPSLVLLLLCVLHFSRAWLASRRLRWVYYTLLVCGSAYVGRFLQHFASATRIPFYELMGAALVYAAFLFVVLSELMLAGLASALTRWRNEKWAKEMDYIYLALGAIGLAISTNRLDIVDQKLSMPEYVGPFILASALVIRALKTRVEIAGWNKPDAN
jgi:hypothetical protein